MWRDVTAGDGSTGPKWIPKPELKTYRVEIRLSRGRWRDSTCLQYDLISARIKLFFVGRTDVQMEEDLIVWEREPPLYIV